jgi:hypothetical protein
VNEAELQAEVCEYLDAQGIKWWHIPKGLARKRKQLADIPDLICIGKKRTFYIELKKPGEKMKLSPGQIEFQELCSHNDIFMYVSNDLTKIMTWVKCICAA